MLLKIVVYRWCSLAVLAAACSVGVCQESRNGADEPVVNADVQTGQVEFFKLLEKYEKTRQDLIDEPDSESKDYKKAQLNVIKGFDLLLNSFYGVPVSGNILSRLPPLKDEKGFWYDYTIGGIAKGQTYIQQCATKIEITDKKTGKIVWTVDGEIINEIVGKVSGELATDSHGLWVRHLIETKDGLNGKILEGSFKLHWGPATWYVRDSSSLDKNGGWIRENINEQGFGEWKNGLTGKSPRGIPPDLPNDRRSLKKVEHAMTGTFKCDSNGIFEYSIKDPTPEKYKK